LETHRQENSSVSDDAYIAVFGKEHAGHVRGMGHGVVPSKYLGRSSGTPASTSGGNDVTREELDASNAKIRSLEEQIAFLTQQFALHSRGSQVINSKHNAIKKTSI
jgi:ABC-type phosphate/phosphonate transport system ATPase subunit